LGTHSPFLKGDQPIDSLETAFERFKMRLNSPAHCLFVAELEQKIVGLAMAHQYEEYLLSGRKQFRFSTLVVLPEYRKQGTGKALFEAIKNWAKASGAKWLEWYASPSAVGFYDKLGYQGETCPQPENPFYEIEFS
jgi:GNAT superfamily N-acetyltransferase